METNRLKSARGRDMTESLARDFERRQQSRSVAVQAEPHDGAGPRRRRERRIDCTESDGKPQRKSLSK